MGGASCDVNVSITYLRCFQMWFLMRSVSLLGIVVSFVMCDVGLSGTCLEIQTLSN